MATVAQIAANRVNAQKSTGPTSIEGKAASRFNALTHGMDAASIVIPGEDPAEYDRIAENHCQTFQPQSALEQFHVDTLIRSDWQRKRLQRTEAKFYRALLAEGATPEELDVAVLRDSPTAKLLRKVFSQIASLERAFQRALNDLRRIQRERDKAQEARGADCGAGLQARALDVELASFPEKPAAAHETLVHIPMPALPSPAVPQLK